MARASTIRSAIGRSSAGASAFDTRLRRVPDFSSDDPHLLDGAVDAVIRQLLTV